MPLTDVIRLRIEAKRTAAMTAGTHPETDLAAQPMDQLTINTIRTLSMDAVQEANLGHPLDQRVGGSIPRGAQTGL
jgi:hypothetical protein